MGTEVGGYQGGLARPDRDGAEMLIYRILAGLFTRI